MTASVVGMLAAAAALAVPNAPVLSKAACPGLGATYESRPNRYGKSPYIYRLTSEASRSVLEIWRIRTVSRRTGRVLSELVYQHGCGNGRAPCYVFPAHSEQPDDGFRSEEVTLNRDWTPVWQDNTPYAIILPGFAENDWAFAGDLLKRDLRYFTKERVAPDLEHSQVWIITRCGPR